VQLTSPKAIMPRRIEPISLGQCGAGRFGLGGSHVPASQVPIHLLGSTVKRTDRADPTEGGGFASHHRAVVGTQCPSRNPKDEWPWKEMKRDPAPKG
jgi:hypothetical protein